MGTLIAILNKNGENTTAEAVAMFRIMKRPDDCFYTLASSSETFVEKADFTGDARLTSSAVIGLGSQREVNQARCRLVKLENATLALAGTIHDANGKGITFDTIGKRFPQLAEGDAETFVRSVEGSFAFTVATARELIAGRDSLGVEPLYYGENSRLTAMASEKKALWKIGISDPKSFPPGHIAIADTKATTFKLVKTLSRFRTRPMNMKTASRELLALLRQSVKCKVSDVDRVAVAFSGGLDSSIVARLAKETAKEVSLIHVGLRNHPETKHATQTAEELDLPIHIHEYTEQDVEETISSVLWTMEECDPVNASIGIPVYWTAERAAAMGLYALLAGQGADELFGGYKRYVDACTQRGKPHAKQMIINDITHIHETNLERDAKICNACGVRLRLPFVTYGIAKLALEMPVELKLQPEATTLRKLVLRQVAENLKLPSSVVNRPKRAMQYSTGVNNALAKLAKRKNLTIAEYLHRVFQTTLKKMMTHDD